MCPPLGRQIVHPSGRIVCHCLLVETDRDGLVLVDTGFGLGDVRNPGARLGAARWLLGPVLDEAATAARQIEALGYRREDVRHLVLTHLDLDHAGGIDDFPAAEVHVLAAERVAARERRTWSERNRYRREQWAHLPEARWVLHEPDGEPWMGFRAARRVGRLPPEILLVPLVGHTRGHAGVAVRAPDRWLLHCGDAYYFGGILAGRRPPAALGAFERLNAMVPAAWRETQARLCELARDHGGEVRLFCAHDPDEWQRCRDDAGPHRTAATG